MQNYELDILRKGVAEQLRKKPAPSQLGILREHAEFLGCDILGDVDPGINRTLGGEPYNIVRVRTRDLVPALEQAVGKDDKVIEVGTQDYNPGKA